MDKGLIQAYSGKGKGKTTAAVGQAVRAVSSGLKVLFVYFNKSKHEDVGEHIKMEEIGIKTIFFAQNHPCHHNKSTPDQMRIQTLKGLEYIRNTYKLNDYDLIVLDEILISLRDGFINENELLTLMNDKPENIELILTGRGITPEIENHADLVSEVKEIKHPLQQGIQYRQGIEK